MTASGLLSVAAIAADRGWDRTTAWRWLRRLERQHGAKLVRDGRTLCIERAELARIALLDRDVAGRKKAKGPPTRAEIDRIVDRLDELDAWKNGIARDVAALRRTMSG